MSSNAYLDEMLNMRDEINVKSEICEFYNELNVLVTGGSGFLGKLIIEKLLRACPNVGTVYVLMRSKKGKTMEERLKEQVDDICYDRIKKERPDFLKHIVLIEGDTGLPDLGLSAENRKILIENTHVIFHGAAIVRFNAPLRSAVNTNVRGTKLLLMLAREMKNLKAFVYISTAFSHCPNKHIEEKFYEAPMDVEKLIQLANMFDEKTLEKITPHVIREWPNTYSFSKAMSEEAVRQYSGNFPTCLVRPSIVVSTYKEPVSGWNNNIYGPTGLVMAGYVCLLRTEFVEKHYNAELIPADYVVNNIIAAAWNIGKKWNESKKSNGIDASKVGKTIVVYNSVTTPQIQVTWDNFFKMNYVHGINVPCKYHMWYYILIPTSNRVLYYIYTVFLHIVPAFIMDTLLQISGRKPMLLDLYKKIHKFGQVYAYFKMQQWKFDNDNVMNLWRSMNTKDRDEFDFNAEHLDWNEYCYHHIRGIRNYILKEPEHTMETGRARYKKFIVAHYALVALLCYLLFVVVNKLLTFLLSFIL